MINRHKMLLKKITSDHACAFRFLRATAECFARLSHRLGVCPSLCRGGCLSISLSVHPSVCLSVTLVICIKTVQGRVTKSLLWAASRYLVYATKFRATGCRGSPRTRVSKMGTPLKRHHFAVIGSNNVKTVGDRYIHAAYHNKHW